MAWRIRWVADDQEAFRLGEPMGAIWYQHGTLILITPAGHANLNAHQVTDAQPESFTVEPSILVRGAGDGRAYHGYLRRGVLSDDIDGRTFPHHPATA
jgi:hypothetical protein